MSLLRRHPALLSLLVIALLVGLPELALRLSGWPPPKGDELLPPHPDLLWTLPAGSYRHDQLIAAINEEGMRGRSPAASSGKLPRILLVGDSSVFGWGVEEEQTLAAHLERLSEGRYEVYNGGVPGYSSEQTVRALERLMPQVAPDLVVIASLWSDTTMTEYSDLQFMALTDGWRYRLSFHAQRLFSASRLWLAVEHLLGFRREPHPLNGVLAHRAQRLSRAVGSERIPVERYRVNLERMAEMAAEADAEALFLMFASREELFPQACAAPTGSFDTPHKRAMVEVAQGRGCRLVRAGPALCASGLPADQLFVDSIHPSGAGHEVLARALLNHLASDGTGGPPRAEPLLPVGARQQDQAAVVGADQQALGQQVEPGGDPSLERQFGAGR